MFLEVESLSASYGHGWVIQDLTVSVDVGQVLGIFGRNGAGKTTLLRSIMGLQTTRGSVRFDSQEISELPSWKRARMGLTLVPEDRRVFSSLTVEENLDLARRAAGQPRDALEKVFEVFPELELLRRRRGGFLSGGEQQMVAIGRAIAGGARLVMIDEPTQGLAPRLFERTERCIRAMARSDAAVLVVEQNFTFGAQVADQCCILDDGRLAFSGLPAELYASSDLVRTLLGVGAEGL